MTENKAKEILLINVSDVKLNPRNRNIHPVDQIERLAKLIKHTGFRDPIIISNRTGFCVAGEGRTLAAKKLNLKEIPAVFQDFESEDEEIAFGVSHNAIAGWATLDFSGINSDLGDLGPDFDIDLLGIKDFEIDVADKNPQCDEDEVPEHVEPKTKLGDIYVLGDHRLMCGDSTSIDSVEKLMNGEKADMVFTDPPYGINLKIGGGNGNGLASKTDYKYIKNDDSTQCAVDCYNLTAGLNIPKLVFWGANYYSSNLPNSKCWIAWDKRGDLPPDDFCGTELAWTNCDKHTKTIKVSWKGMIKEGEHGKRMHPNQKPILLNESCFNYLEAGKNILDLFGGSGSTLIACEKTNRKCFMSELDPHYVDVIVQRWMKYTGKIAYLIEDLSGKLKEPVPYVKIDSFQGENT